jgi:hypothetical protein
MKSLVDMLGQNSVSLGGGNSKKQNKMTQEQRNKLLSQLSQQMTKTQTTEQVVEHKPFKDMNLQEKKIYREELKQRMHTKQNTFKQKRTNYSLLKKKLDVLKEEQEKQTEQTTQENNLQEDNLQEDKESTDKQDVIESLDDFTV